ncbi:hypothetical protein SAMN04487935_1889 [Flavobacterium noncentrifugens]|uniref:Uncharacterized protein n=1 Tax=Flavobacterium noncentrifugens TaxID=1128970 RepID=A0A1G8WN55_9FLAO|nr:hypothetical protein SAMN04487935_1889 [Flavobacterium noncentrifugens]
MICIFGINIFENDIVLIIRIVNFEVFGFAMQISNNHRVDLDDNKYSIFQKMVSLAFPILFR